MAAGFDGKTGPQAMLSGSRVRGCWLVKKKINVSISSEIWFDFVVEIVTNYSSGNEHKNRDEL